MPPQTPYLISGTISGGTPNDTVVILSDDYGHSDELIVDGNNRYLFDIANWDYVDGQNVYVEVYDPGASFIVKLWDDSNKIMLDSFSSSKLEISDVATTYGHAKQIYDGKGLAVGNSLLRFDISDSNCNGDFELLMMWSWI